MQKSILFIFALSMIFVIGANIASAEMGLRRDASSSATSNATGTSNKFPLPPRDAHQKITGNPKPTAMERGTSTMGEPRQERIEKLSAQRKEIIKRQAEMMFQRIEAAIERLKKLGVRIEERIIKLRGKGMNTTKAGSLLVSARTEITNTETHLGMAKTAAQEAIESETPKEAFEAVRAHVEQVRDAAKRAHKALIDSIVALKGKSGNKTATTTATTTTP
ncbi:MAG: hypothetical protein Q7S11_03720 [bacterium]|nr:hypothetical protein [bacterium]